MQAPLFNHIKNHRSMNAWDDTYTLIFILTGMIILAGMFFGYKIGLLKMLQFLFALAMGITMAMFLYKPAAAYLSEYVALPHGPWHYMLSFAGLFLLPTMLFYLPALVIMRRVDARVHYSPASRWLGILPGAMASLALALIVVFIYLLWPLSYKTPLPIADNVLPYFLKQQLPVELTVSHHNLPANDVTLGVSKDNDHWNTSMAVEAGDGTPVAYSAQPTLENLMLALILNERKAHGLQPLHMQKNLVQLARNHALDMMVRHYFSHESPEGLTPFARMQNAGIVYKTAGENLAKSQDIVQAHKQLMMSPGHRANLLNPKFGSIGIGVVSDGAGNLLIAQEFKN